MPVAITPPGTGCACMFKEGYEEGLSQFASAVDSIDKEKNSENLIMSVDNILTMAVELIGIVRAWWKASHVRMFRLQGEHSQGQAFRSKFQAKQPHAHV